MEFAKNTKPFKNRKLCPIDVNRVYVNRLYLCGTSDLSKINYSQTMYIEIGLRIDDLLEERHDVVTAYKSDWSKIVEKNVSISKKS